MGAVWWLRLFVLGALMLWASSPLRLAAATPKVGGGEGGHDVYHSGEEGGAPASASSSSAAPPASSFSLLAAAARHDGFLMARVNGSESSSSLPGMNVSRLAYTLASDQYACLSTASPLFHTSSSSSSPSSSSSSMAIAEVVVAIKDRRVALLGVRMTGSSPRRSSGSGGSGNGGEEADATNLKEDDRAHVADHDGEDDRMPEIVYARELVIAVDQLRVGGVAVDWARRRAFFSDNVLTSVRAVSLDLSAPVKLDEAPIIAQLPRTAPSGHANNLLGDLVLDDERDVLYLGVGADRNGYPGRDHPAVWSLRTDGSDVRVVRNLTDYSSSSSLWTPPPPVLTLSQRTALDMQGPVEDGARRLLTMTLNARYPYPSRFDLRAFDLPLTPDSGNGSILAEAIVSSPAGIVDDGQGWLYVADEREGITRLRTNGSDRTPRFVQLAADDIPLMAINLAPTAAKGGHQLLIYAKNRLYAAPTQPPVNLTMLALGQSQNGVTGLAMDPFSCRMWYMDDGRLYWRQANEWRPAERLDNRYAYAISNLAVDASNQLYYARTDLAIPQIARINGNLDRDSASVLIDSFAYQADGRRMTTDPIARKFYYVSNGVLFRSELDGSHSSIYVRTRSGTRVSSFALDVKRRLLFVSESSVPASMIYKVELDAPAAPQPVLVFSSIGGHHGPPIAMASDPISGMLYTLECVRSSCYLYAISLGPTSSLSNATLLSSFIGRQPSSMQLDSQYQALYLIDSVGKTIFHCSLDGNISYSSCHDLHLSPHNQLVAIAVDAPRRQLYAIDKPSNTVVRFDMADSEDPQPRLGDPFEVIHQLQPDELPIGTVPQHIQIDPDTGLLYVRTSTGIARGVMHHERPAPYTPLKPLINDQQLVAFTLDRLHQRLHWVRLNAKTRLVQLWSAAVDGTDARLVADWSHETSCVFPYAVHWEPSVNVSAPTELWIVSSRSAVCHWNGTTMRSVISFNNYGNMMSSAYDPSAHRVYVSGTYWQDVPTIFAADVINRKGNMLQLKDDARIDGITAVPGALFAARLLGGPLGKNPAVVTRWKVNTSTAAQVLRAIPPDYMLIDMQRSDRPIYFTDWQGATIWTARSDGTGQRLTHRPIQAENVDVSAFWIDSDLQLIYWTEQRALDTRVAHLGSLDNAITVLLMPVSSGINKQIVVDDERGWIYWSDPSMGKLMRARLDGSNIECVWMTDAVLDMIEPISGDVIGHQTNYSQYSISVIRRSMATGEVSTLLSLSTFSQQISLMGVQLDPRPASGGCARLWLSAIAYSSSGNPKPYLATACVGDKHITPLTGLSVMPSSYSYLQLLPDLSHCLPPSHV